MSLSQQRTASQLNLHEHRVTVLLHSTPKTQVAVVDSQTSPVLRQTFTCHICLSHIQQQLALSYAQIKQQKYRNPFQIFKPLHFLNMI